VSASFLIDSLPERAERYRKDHALVAVDVFRAATVILTALAAGRAVFPVSTVAEAWNAAARLPDAVLAGEQRGVVPAGFDLDNSPALLERLPGRKPLILLTSAGTRLLQACRGACAVYVACLRNLRSTAEHLAAREERIALIGAGTAGEARPEDQLVCAWIGQHLLAYGFTAEDAATVREVDEYRGRDLEEVLRDSPSASWLRASGKSRDLEFTLVHLDDMNRAARFDGDRVELCAGCLDADRMAGFSFSALDAGERPLPRSAG
jgi:2-phosphosulfolactate phosphatase